MVFLLACGGGGGEPTSAPFVITKATPSGDAQSGIVAAALPAPLAVLITQDGVPVEGRSVTFTPSGGSGTVAPSPVLTDVNGVASATWTLGQVSGARAVTVSSPGVTGGPLHFTATALPGPPSLALASGGQGQVQEAGMSFPVLLTARVQDGFGNGIAGMTVHWTVTAGPGTVGGPTSVTGAGGGAVMGVTAGGTAGTISVIAVADTLPADTIAFSLTVTPIASVVTVGNNFFSPDTVTIPVGGAIRWSWTGGPHNVTPETGPATFPGSATLGAGSSYGPLVFDVAGTYTYQCTIHANMVGTIKVQ
jgi:plastocyanin